MRKLCGDLSPEYFEMIIILVAGVFPWYIRGMICANRTLTRTSVLNAFHTNADIGRAH